MIETAAIPDDEPRLNILVALPYFKNALPPLAARAPHARIFIDSGAFTAWRSGKPIGLDDYCRALESLPVKPWRYMSLDVVGDSEGSHRNYETMLKRGFKPVPVMTRGEDPSVLDDLYRTSDVVAVGGLVGTTGNTGYVKGIMDRAAGRPIHLLGFTRHRFLTTFKPYSVDSSSWESGTRYGQIQLYLGRGRWKTLGRADFATRPPLSIMETIAGYGVDPRSLAKAANWTGGNAPHRYLGAASAVAYSLDVHKHLGTHFFNAVAAGCGCGVLIDAYERLNP